MTQRRGLLIALEGLDGAGVTTHALRLEKWVRDEERVAVYLTKEPTDSLIGYIIRLILQQQEVQMKIKQPLMALLFAADRNFHVFQERSSGIIGMLNEGRVVIVDRYYLSSLAYQQVSKDGNPPLSADWIRVVNCLKPHVKCNHCGETVDLDFLPFEMPIPDVTFFIDIPLEIAQQRIARTRYKLEITEDRFEQQQAMNNYNRLIDEMREDGNNVVKIPMVDNGTERTIEEVQQSIKDVLSPLIEKTRKEGTITALMGDSHW